ncbi:MAG: terminase gpA endonuclease subunit, partial [Planctomycetaceae bacterium]
LSALQHAMNLWIRDPVAFASEFQNDPVSAQQDTQEERLTAEDLLQPERMTSLARYAVPLAANVVTAFIDVQKRVLYYVVVAWEDGFTGQVIDYGTFPDQRMTYFVLRKVKRTLADLLPRAGEESAIYQGLEALEDQLRTRVWKRDDGAEMRLNRLVIDAGWMTDLVHRFCREGTSSSIIIPSHGKYVGARNRPFSEYKRKRGDRLGHHWRIPAVTGARRNRHLMFDTNYWKTFVHARLKTPVGDRGALSFFESVRGHRMIAEHLTAETFVRVEAQASGRVVDEWKLPVAGADNHLFDCLVGCAVGASMEGITLAEAGATATRRKPRKSKGLSLAERRALKRGR